jgi:16S rRNA (cytosine1402-N4)-methyltransferase
MHVPVLTKEVLKHLDPKANENFIDATVGEGGHALMILEKTAPRGKILGIDWSQDAIKILKSKPAYRGVQERLTLVCDNYANLAEIVKNNKIGKINGILLDLGMSSWDLEGSGRGFSFQRRETLDMRYSFTNQLTAQKIVNFWSRFEIEKILQDFGEEEFAREIAEKIIEERKLRTIENTLQLVGIIEKAVPASYVRGRLHFATKTFQALRIAVNGELDNLQKVLSQLSSIIEPQGRIAVISFQSLEDRIVKNFFKDNNAFSPVVKKPIEPSLEEIRQNPRSRSAKLRVHVKL